MDKSLDKISDSRISCLTIENGVHYWNSPATGYGRVEEDFGTNLPLIKTGRILDLGCSEGRSTKEIQIIYPNCRVIGIDRFEERIEKARKNAPDCEFLIADAYKELPFPANSFEAVFCMNNLWYIMSKQRNMVPEQVFHRIFDLIKPEGYLFFSGSVKGAILRKENPITLQYRRPKDFAPQVDTLVKILQEYQNSSNKSN